VLLLGHAFAPSGPGLVLAAPGVTPLVVAVALSVLNWWAMGQGKGSGSGGGAPGRQGWEGRHLPPKLDPSMPSSPARSDAAP
jgi:hypothetical protein